jgi:ATP-dependent Clp protease ATP-binding subunit ClpA
MFDRFTERARRMMSLAREAAQRFQHDYIGTEHMLLGIVGIDECVGATVLRELNVEPAAVRAEVEKIVKPGAGPVTYGQLPFTPRGKRVLEFALEEAQAFGHGYIGTEHLLLGLVLEETGVAARVLVGRFALDVDRVRAKVLEHVPGNPDAARARRPVPSLDARPSPLRWLGLLGLLGLLGFVDPRLGYLGFLGFLGLFGMTARRGASR